MKLESPFFLTKVECPVCGQINEFENIKAGAYTETDRDTDFCPKGIIWANPEYQKINPLLYFMATCRNCFYTHEFNESFKEWKMDRFFVTCRRSLIQEKHRRELKPERGVINRLGEALDPEGHPFESAVIKLLLGIYDEKIIEGSNPLDLGRYYLRIAWLYRENQKRKNAPHEIEKLNLTSLEQTLISLQSNFQNQERKIYDLKASLDACFPTETGMAEMDQKKEQLQLKYLKGLEKIQEDISSLQEGLDELVDICAQHHDFSSGSESENIPASPRAVEMFVSGEFPYEEQDHPSFVSFLSSLKEILGEVPINECEAMKLALKYYKQNYQEEKDVTQENQKIQSAYVIAELSRRVGDYPEAENYFKEAQRTAQDFIRKNRDNTNKIALARKIMELASKQGRLNLVVAKSHI